MTTINHYKKRKFTIWHLLPIVFGICSLVTIWLFISSLITFYNFRLKDPLHTIGTVSSIDTTEAIFVSVKVKNLKNETVIVENKIGNIIEGMKIGDKIGVLYFDETMNDAVLDTFWNIEGVVIFNSTFMIGFVFFTTVLILPIFFNYHPSWITFIVNINQEE